MVYDVCQRESFDNLRYWLRELDAHSTNPNIVKIIVGNKIDKVNKRFKWIFINAKIFCFRKKKIHKLFDKFPKKKVVNSQGFILLFLLRQVQRQRRDFFNALMNWWKMFCNNNNKKLNLKRQMSLLLTLEIPLALLQGVPWEFAAAE